MKKRIFIMVSLTLFMVGCSKSPMDRLKACYLDKNGKIVDCQNSDHAFWNNEADKHSDLFEEALQYCKKRDNTLYNPLCGNVILPDSEPILKYGDHPLPEPYYEDNHH